MNNLYIITLVLVIVLIVIVSLKGEGVLPPTLNSVNVYIAMAVIIIISVLIGSSTGGGDDQYGDNEGLQLSDSFTPAPDTIDIDIDIDAVYTWVDSSDPEWLKEMQRFKTTKTDDTRVQRFKNHDEILYSIRSIEAFAPWIRNIYIVTYSKDKYPIWLNIDHPKVHIVPHSEIFKNPFDLPTFNSHSIEANLCNIPGLSDKFLYANDDTFFGKPVSKSDFIDEDGVLLIGRGHTFEYSEIPGSAYGKAWMKLFKLVKDEYGLGNTMTKQSHQIQILDKNILMNMHPAEIEVTSASRFRSGDDIPPIGAGIQKMIFGGSARFIDRDELYFEREILEYGLAKFVCVNDANKYKAHDYEKFYNAYCLYKSSYEKFKQLRPYKMLPKSPIEL